MPSDGYPSTPNSQRVPTPHALAAGLLAATNGSYDIALFVLRQAIVLLENARPQG